MPGSPFLTILLKPTGKPLVKHHINILFILTNDQSSWLDSLREELERYDWKIVTSHQIKFTTAQEQDVSMAIDMDLARKAAIFMGNGVCASIFLREDGPDQDLCSGAPSRAISSTGDSSTKRSLWPTASSEA